jgi:hypothetical protein
MRPPHSAASPFSLQECGHMSRPHASNRFQLSTNRTMVGEALTTRFNVP